MFRFTSKKLQPFMLHSGVGGGMYHIPFTQDGHPASVLQVIASNGLGWEHVSVSVCNVKRCPVWEEMCFIKGLFWTDQDWVVQYHPATKDYVNCHPYTLHLWSPQDKPFPKPPSYLVGPKGRSPE